MYVTYMFGSESRNREPPTLLMTLLVEPDTLHADLVFAEIFFAYCQHGVFIIKSKSFIFSGPVFWSSSSMRACGMYTIEYDSETSQHISSAVECLVVVTQPQARKQNFATSFKNL